MWREQPLSSLATISSGGTPSRDNSTFWNGDIPWVTPTDISACRTNYLADTADKITKAGLLGCSAKLLPAGTILFTSRATVGDSRIADASVCTNQGFKNLTPMAGVDGKFLFYQVQRIRGAFKRYAAGSTFPEINKKDTGRVLIPHPVDVRTQQKIAAILTSIDTAIEKTEALIEKYQQIKAGLMHDLFARGVLPNGQIRPPREQAPELYQETAIGWIPNEWSADRLAVYLDPTNGIKPGPFGSSLTKDQYTSAGFRIYGQEQVIAGSLAIGDYYISAAKFAEMRAFEVVENDVLLSLVGTVGCVLVVSAPFEPGIINPRLIRLRPAPKKVSADFLRYLLLTNNVGRQIDNLSGGGTMPVINGKVIRRIAVPIVNIAEQALIVDRLGALERQLSSTISQLSKLKSQKLGLMQDLLTGKVPVRVGAGETAND